VRYCHIYESGLAGEVLEDVQQDLEGELTVKLALTLVRLQQILQKRQILVLCYSTGYLTSLIELSAIDFRQLQAEKEAIVCLIVRIYVRLQISDKNTGRCRNKLHKKNLKNMTVSLRTVQTVSNYV
jgi:hypothetical protein